LKLEVNGSIEKTFTLGNNNNALRTFDYSGTTFNNGDQIRIKFLTNGASALDKVEIGSSNGSNLSAGANATINITPLDGIAPQILNIEETGIEIQGTFPMKLFPNPVIQSSINAEFGVPIIGTGFIYDKSGRIIRTIPIDGLRINIKMMDIHPGVYLLKVIRDNGSIAMKQFVRQ